MSKSAIIIPSRLEAKRLPNKPLLKINNIPMIIHVMQKAKESKIGEVIVATPDKEILDLVKKNSGNAILTSKDHPTGTDRVYEVTKKINSDIYVNLQGDEPLINPKNIDKNTKNNSFDNIGSFEDIIELSGKHKFLILKKFLQEDVRLVSFENGHIDINVPEGSEEIIKELIVKLYDWTDQRWIINVSSKKGEDTILEKQNNIQNNIVDEVSNKEEIKKVMEAFPDSKITSISKVDNRNESK